VTALRCPVCGGTLLRQEKVFRCEKGHSFDLARQGYVNLMVHNGSGKRHGDDKRMVSARTAFLDKGFYDPLSRLLCELAGKTEGDVLLADAGCGEGKYTCDILNALKSSGRKAEGVGVDISREALIAAARRDRSLTLAVASSAQLPLLSGCCDMVLNVFSPFCREEFLRVLKPGGTLLRVWPLEQHLWELKTLVYDEPYPNRPPEPEAEGFILSEYRELRYAITLHGAEIGALFEMTPYYYKTSREDQQKAEEAAELTVRLEFGVGRYTKAGDAP